MSKGNRRGDNLLLKTMAVFLVLVVVAIVLFDFFCRKGVIVYTIFDGLISVLSFIGAIVATVIVLFLSALLFGGCDDSEEGDGEEEDSDEEDWEDDY